MGNVSNHSLSAVTSCTILSPPRFTTLPVIVLSLSFEQLTLLFLLGQCDRYVAKNAGRVSRALFEIALKNAWPVTAARFLRLTIAIDRQVWWADSPLRQFRMLKGEIIAKLEERHMTLNVLRDSQASDIGSIVRHPLMGNTIKSCVERVPRLYIDAAIQPITRRILRVTLTLEADFEWVQKIHGEQQSWCVAKRRSPLFPLFVACNLFLLNPIGRRSPTSRGEHCKW